MGGGAGTATSVAFTGLGFASAVELLLNCCWAVLGHGGRFATACHSLAAFVMARCPKSMAASWQSFWAGRAEVSFIRDAVRRCSIL